MTNEEALKELKECLDNSDCGEQVYFPYVSEDAIRVAVYAIERQIPKRLEHKEMFVHLLHKKMESQQCPICGNDYGGTLSHGCNYCDICGQRLDWGNGNDKP